MVSLESKLKVVVAEVDRIQEQASLTARLQVRSSGQHSRGWAAPRRARATLLFFFGPASVTLPTHPCAAASALLGHQLCKCARSGCHVCLLNSCRVRHTLHRRCSTLQDKTSDMMAALETALSAQSSKYATVSQQLRLELKEAVAKASQVKTTAWSPPRRLLACCLLLCVHQQPSDALSPSALALLAQGLVVAARSCVPSLTAVCCCPRNCGLLCRLSPPKPRHWRHRSGSRVTRWLSWLLLCQSCPPRAHC